MKKYSLVGIIDEFNVERWEGECSLPGRIPVVERADFTAAPDCIQIRIIGFNNNVSSINMTSVAKLIGS
jgi:hypothetical protein